MLGLEAERRLIGHGVSTCATCDGFFFQGQTHRRGRRRRLGPRGGDLPHQVRREGVTVIHRRDAAAGLEDHAGAGVQERQDRVRLGLGGRRAAWATTSCDGVKVRNVKTGRGVRPARSPGCSWPSATCPTPTCSRASSTWTTPATSSPTAAPAPTSRACSPPATCQDHVYRQAITAAGSGCMAAIDAERWLESQPHEPRSLETPTDAVIPEWCLRMLMALRLGHGRGIAGPRRRCIVHAGNVLAQVRTGGRHG